MIKSKLIFLLLTMFVFQHGVAQFILQPDDFFQCTGKEATFSVETDYLFPLFQWQKNEADTWVNIDSLNAGDIYEGFNSKVLIVNIPDNGLLALRFQCVVTDTIFNTTITSNEAELILVDYPVVDFDYLFPCENQVTQFINKTIDPYENPLWHWEFGDNELSALENPTHIFTSATNYNVSLTATNQYGCSSSFEKEIIILPNSIMTIVGDEIVCSNQSGIKSVYTVENVNPEAIHHWKLSDELGTIHVTSDTEISISWNIIYPAMQVVLTVTEEDTLNGCFSSTQKEILVTTNQAPDPGKIINKSDNNAVLIFLGSRMKTYRWGYTDKIAGEEIYINDSWNKTYYDFGDMDILSNQFDYWVETSNNARIICWTRTIFDNGNKKNMLDDNGLNFSVYPNPATGNQLWICMVETESTVIKAKLYDFTGKVIKENIFNNTLNNQFHEVNISGVPSGIYMLVVNNGTRMANEKIIINK